MRRVTRPATAATAGTCHHAEPFDTDADDNRRHGLHHVYKPHGYPDTGSPSEWLHDNTDIARYHDLYVGADRNHHVAHHDPALDFVTTNEDDPDAHNDDDVDCTVTTSEEPHPWTRSAERWLSLAAVFVAPTSLITGLCYFFARLSIGHRMHYFGADPSALGYTTADYVVTTIGVFFFVTLVALFVCAILVLLVVAIRRWARSGRRIALLRTLAWIALTVGATALSAAMVWLLFEYSPIDKVADALVGKHEARYTAWAILAGIGLLAAGYGMLSISGGVLRGARMPRGAERMLLGVVAAGMVVALFWMTDLYAVKVGEDRAAYDAQQLWPSDGDFTAVQLDTTDALDLPDDLVKTSVLPTAGPATTPTYRYECLRVLDVHGGRYVLVPAKWQHDRGYAITVTPDATHRLNGVVRTENSGQDANVYSFWQCPEVVRSFQELDLGPMLIGLDVAQTVTGVRGLTPHPVNIAGPAPATAMSANSCAPQNNPNEIPAALPYPDNTVATKQVEFTGDSPGGRLYVRQRVTALVDAASAAIFRSSAETHWRYCAGHTVGTNREGMPRQRTLGTPGVQKDVLAVADSAPGSNVTDCAQALAVKANVVVHVDVCGTAQPLQAAGIAAAIRDRIPT